MTDPARTSTLSMLTVAQSERLRKRRRLIDYFARGGIMLGGVGVIAAVALIFFYLLYEVVPLFTPAQAERVAQWSLPADVPADTLFAALEEQNEIGFRLTGDGTLLFFEAGTGKTIRQERLAHSDKARITAVATASPGGETLAVGFDDGQVVIVHETYSARYDDDGKRTLQAEIEYPMGNTPFSLLPGQPVAQLAVSGSDTLQLVARAADGSVVASRFGSRENMMTGEVTVSEEAGAATKLTGDIENLALVQDGRFLLATFRDGRIAALDVNDFSAPRSEQHLPAGTTITTSAVLLGNTSLLVGDDQGNVHQLFMVRDEHNTWHLTQVRTLPFGDSPIVQIKAEQRRKSLVAVNARGEIGLLNAPAEKLSLSLPPGAEKITGVAMAPRGDGLLVLHANGASHFHVKNEHPDVSFSALWQKVWYEGYAEADYIWQSSAANADFEPKYSLVPLVFGTIKAAFFAMLLAIPLAICGAIYTAYFMAPALRRTIKPTIELMEALPTVILGFLAGLWLAPMVEGALPGIFAMLLFTPLLIVAAAWAWFRLPEKIRLRIPNGYEGLLLVPVIALGVGIPLSASDWMETALFSGDMRLWLRDVMGIPFDQRNALIIGFAMGFAVIPTIYSIAEDALFEVPKHLTQGSLALGATPWQTVMRVVLPTASPGIFSAVMMGFGRAVGETMIVLMATGNTPVMTMNLFEGLRTLSANIAVEMPESEVGSSHFRILFLAALVLFLFTFIVNTSAELIRQRLRKQYGTL